MTIESFLNKHQRKDNDTYLPLIFDLKKQKSRASFLKTFKRLNPKVIDELAEQSREVQYMKNPRLLLKSPRSKATSYATTTGFWVYYPWHNSLVHILPKADYLKLRSSRNRNLILPTEQKRINQSVVGFAGLNVGYYGALCLTLESEAQIKLADFDTLSVSNLNRFPAGLTELGLNKAVLAARQIFEINPFSKVTVFPKGLELGDEDNFFVNPEPDILVEETDNLKLKIILRQRARQYGIPVVMVTGNGPNLILDVERYDKNKNLPILNGHLRTTVANKINNLKSDGISFKDKINLARDFMGVPNLTPRLRKSFQLVGSKLAGIPQLAEASFLRGAVLGFTIRRIVTGAKMPSGRYFVNLDKII